MKYDDEYFAGLEERFASVYADTSAAGMSERAMRFRRFCQKTRPVRRSPDAPERRIIHRLYQEELRGALVQLWGSVTLDPAMSPPQAVAFRTIVQVTHAGKRSSDAVQQWNEEAPSGERWTEDVARSRVKLASKRAGLDGNATLESHTDGENERLFSYLDPDHERKVRDATYLLLGVGLALRHVSLANLQIPDVRQTDSGFS